MRKNMKNDRIDASAERYWIDHSLISHYHANPLRVNVVIIGSGADTDRLLYYGLLDNIYKADQSIIYHIYGNSVDSTHICTDFDRMNGDKVVFHGHISENNVRQIGTVDRVVIMDRGEVFEPSEAGSFGEGVEIHRLRLCEDDGTSEEEKLAMELNYQYECLYGSENPDVSDREERKRLCWERLSDFAKASNKAAVGYHNLRMQIIERRKNLRFECPQWEHMEMLSELEHIKWCRFHFLNGWKKGEMEGEKGKNEKKKTHSSLIPYAELSREEKDKDREVIELMFRIGERKSHPNIVE